MVSFGVMIVVCLLLTLVSVFSFFSWIESESKLWFLICTSTVVILTIMLVKTVEQAQKVDDKLQKDRILEFIERIVNDTTHSVGGE